MANLSADQFALSLNSSVLPESVTNNSTASCIIEATAPNAVLNVISTTNTTVQILENNGNGTQTTINASIIIERLS
jgi:hypothetical protein